MAHTARKIISASKRNTSTLDRRTVLSSIRKTFNFESTRETQDEQSVRESHVQTRSKFNALVELSKLQWKSKIEVRKFLSNLERTLLLSLAKHVLQQPIKSKKTETLIEMLVPKFKLQRDKIKKFLILNLKERKEQAKTSHSSTEPPLHKRYRNEVELLLASSSKNPAPLTEVCLSQFDSEASQHSDVIVQLQSDSDDEKRKRKSRSPLLTPRKGSKRSEKKTKKPAGNNIIQIPLREDILKTPQKTVFDQKHKALRKQVQKQIQEQTTQPKKIFPAKATKSVCSRKTVTHKEKSLSRKVNQSVQLSSTNPRTNAMSKASSDSSQGAKNLATEKEDLQSLIKPDPEVKQPSIAEKLLPQILSVPAVLIKFLLPNFIKQDRIKSEHPKFETPKNNCYCKGGSFSKRESLQCLRCLNNFHRDCVTEKISGKIYNSDKYFECFECQLGLMNIFRLPVMSLNAPQFIHPKEKPIPVNFPFTVDSDLLKLIRFSQTDDVEFPKYRGDKDGIYHSRFMVELRAIALKQTSQHRKRDFLYSQNWPKDVAISINGKVVIEEKYDPQEPRKDRPVQITQFLSPGKNLLSIKTRMYQDHKYAFGVFVTRIIKPQLIEKFVKTQCIDYFESSRSNIISKALQQFQLFESQSKSDESDLEVESRQAFVLKDPYTYQMLQVPVRGDTCRHAQCFDLKSYLFQNYNCKLFNCPLCNQRPVRFVVDIFMYTMVQFYNSKILPFYSPPKPQFQDQEELPPEAKVELHFEKTTEIYKISMIKFDEEEQGKSMFEIDDFYLHQNDQTDLPLDRCELFPQNSLKEKSDIEYLISKMTEEDGTIKVKSVVDASGKEVLEFEDDDDDDDQPPAQQSIFASTKSMAMCFGINTAGSQSPASQLEDLLNVCRLQ